MNNYRLKAGKFGESSIHAAVLGPKTLRCSSGGLRLGQPGDLFSTDGRRKQRHGVSTQHARRANDPRGNSGFSGGAI
jgi:hypothetical protein